MKKSKSEQNNLALSLELLRRIPRNRKISTAEIHAQLSEAGLARSLRTIQRQLDTLSEHFEIEKDERSKPFGYSWKEKAKGLSMPLLNPQESLLLILAQEQLRHLLPVSLMKSMDDFFRQARYNLDDSGNKRLEKEWLSKIRVVSETQPLLPPKIKADVFETVSRALFANKWLNINYKNASGTCAEADVMPLGLAQQGPRLYLVCRYKGFNNERTLALHRILDAKASTLDFTRPPEFTLQKYDADGRFGFGEGQHIELQFNISKECGGHLLETPLSKDQQVRDMDEHYAITATVVDSARLTWWLRGFGDGVWGIVRTPVATSLVGEKAMGESQRPD